MTGKEILEEEFEKAGMRGYKADQVDAFLQTVATYVDEQDANSSDLIYKIQILADKIEEYKKDEESITDVLLGAQKLSASILNEAKSKAEIITREAKNSSDQLLSQSKAKIDSLTRESLQKVDYEINTIKRECEREQKKLDLMKLEVSNFRSSILRQYKAHLDLLSNLPSVDNSNDSIQFNTQPSQPLSNQDKQPDTNEATIGELQQTNTEQNSDISNEKDNELEISSSQTIRSEVISSENEQEVNQHTREFNKQTTSNISAHDMDNIEPQTDVKHIKTSSQRTNFVEKYGELNFGKHKDK